MTAGRPRKPTPLHALQGTYRRDRHGDPPPEPAIASLRPPRWLSPPGRKVWKELAPLAVGLGVLTEPDVELFGHACAQLAIARVDPHNVKALDAAGKLLARFGFTPSDRAKLSIKPKTEDPFDEFLAKKVQ